MMKRFVDESLLVLGAIVVTIVLSFALMGVVFANEQPKPPATLMVLVGDLNVAQDVAAHTCPGAIGKAQDIMKGKSLCGLCITARGELHVPWYCESPDLNPEHADQRFTGPYIAIEYAQGPVPQIEAIYQGPTDYVCTRLIPAELERHRICLKERRVHRMDGNAP